MGKCYNSVVVDAPIAKVWDTLKDFHQGAWGMGVIEMVEKVGFENGSTIGAKRVLNGMFHETLRGLDETSKMIKY